MRFMRALWLWFGVLVLMVCDANPARWVADEAEL